MATKGKTGVLLINLGTPRSPEPNEVGVYLREFLIDPYVVDIPFPLRWLLVNAFIVPHRSRASSALYRKIWTKEGSPLLIHLIELVAKVRRRLGDDYLVVPGMRYGEPRLLDAVSFLKDAGISRLICFPLYPQYSLAATESSIARVNQILRQLALTTPVVFIPPFYAEPEYLDCVVAISEPHLRSAPFDRVLFSFHGLPERQVKRTDPTGRHCLQTDRCSESIVDANRRCYRAQSFATAKAVAAKLQLRPEQYHICFQSRLGRSPWIRPFTDELYRCLPAQGVKHLAVLCPSFVADCLETLEEVQIRGREEFFRHGGQTLRLVPSLNSEDRWVEAVCGMLQKYGG